MSNNLFPITDPRHAMVSGYFKKYNETVAKYAAGQKELSTGIKDLKNLTQETTFELNSTLNHLRQYNDKTQLAKDFLEIKETLTKHATDRKEKRDGALQTKQEKKVEKTELCAEVERLKAEIESLKQENDTIQVKLGSEDQLPLICRLMKSTE